MLPPPAAPRTAAGRPGRRRRGLPGMSARAGTPQVEPARPDPRTPPRAARAPSRRQGQRRCRAAATCPPSAGSAAAAVRPPAAGSCPAAAACTAGAAAQVRVGGSRRGSPRRLRHLRAPASGQPRPSCRCIRSSSFGAAAPAAPSSSAAAAAAAGRRKGREGTPLRPAPAASAPSASETASAPGWAGTLASSFASRGWTFEAAGDSTSNILQSRLQ
mmetsp:Transcript_44429/g.71305  ORF Transcript_44429/g.71305 Transcript_44429/m.71305 type:complete len:216 (-) Transcript_44429:285-932(-)